MKRKSIAFIVIVSMLLTLASFSLSFADTSAPGQVTIKSVKAKTATQKAGKATVTVKWKKQKGVSSYQVFVKRQDGDWSCVKKVGGKKTSAKFKAYAGKNEIRICAVKKTGDQTLAGPFSKTKSFKVKSKMTLQKYMKKHGSMRQQAEQEAAKGGMTLQFRDNDMIYTYDLSQDIGASSITPELVNSLDSSLLKDASTYSGAAKDVGNKLKIGGIRVIIKFTHNGTTVLTRDFY